MVVNHPRKYGRCGEGVELSKLSAFSVLRRRWVVERTIGWNGRKRRLAIDGGLSLFGCGATHAQAIGRFMAFRASSR